MVLIGLYLLSTHYTPHTESYISQSEKHLPIVRSMPEKNLRSLKRACPDVLWFKTLNIQKLPGQSQIHVDKSFWRFKICPNVNRQKMKLSSVQSVLVFVLAVGRSLLAY